MRKKLLIVEDNTELLELLRLGFKQAGFLVNTAANGVEALKKARALVPDLIVLDLILPELDGFEVCEALKRGADTASIPIIMLTGLTSEFTRFAGMESGADEYVTKPISPDQLLPRINYWLHKPRLAAKEGTTTQAKPVRPEASSAEGTRSKHSIRQVESKRQFFGRRGSSKAF